MSPVSWRLSGRGLFLGLTLLLSSGTGSGATGAEGPRLDLPQVDTNSTVIVRVHAEGGAGLRYPLQSSTNLLSWSTLTTFGAGAPYVYLDRCRPAPARQFYQARVAPAPDAVTGDHLPTASGDAVFHPVNHASLVFQWNGSTVYIDPVGGATPYLNLPRADLAAFTRQVGSDLGIEVRARPWY